VLRSDAVILDVHQSLRKLRRQNSRLELTHAPRGPHARHEAREWVLDQRANEKPHHAREEPLRARLVREHRSVQQENVQHERDVHDEHHPEQHFERLPHLPRLLPRNVHATANEHALAKMTAEVALNRNGRVPVHFILRHQQPIRERDHGGDHQSHETNAETANHEGEAAVLQNLREDLVAELGSGKAEQYDHYTEKPVADRDADDNELKANEGKRVRRGGEKEGTGTTGGDSLEAEWLAPDSIEVS
jgi:hypothetical protein